MTKLINPTCPRCYGTGIDLDWRATGASRKAARLAAGLTARLVAKRMGVHPSFLCDLESGKRRFTLARLAAHKAACANGTAGSTTIS